MLSLGCHYKDKSEWNPRKASATLRKIATASEFNALPMQLNEKGLKRTSKITQLQATQHGTEKESEITKRKQKCRQSSYSIDTKRNAIRIHLTTPVRTSRGDKPSHQACAMFRPWSNHKDTT
jgi:hypothetical protein